MDLSHLATSVQAAACWGTLPAAVQCSQRPQVGSLSYLQFIGGEKTVRAKRSASLLPLTLCGWWHMSKKCEKWVLGAPVQSNSFSDSLCTCENSSVIKPGKPSLCGYLCGSHRYKEWEAWVGMEQESYPNSIVTAYNLSLARNLKEFSKLIRLCLLFLPENISVIVAAYYLPVFSVFFYFLGVTLFDNTKISPMYRADNAPQKLFLRFFF